MAKWTDPHVVLGIARGAEAEELRRAYRRALLQYHPDKLEGAQLKGAQLEGAQLEGARLEGATPLYTIDDVNQAYGMLRKGDVGPEQDGLVDGVVNFNEVCDLGTFEEHELGDGSMQWFKDCRCGEQGYKLTELDLESNGDADEIAVQCAGCSLWILVQYAVE